MYCVKCSLKDKIDENKYILDHLIHVKNLNLLDHQVIRQSELLDGLVSECMKCKGI